MRKIKFNAIDTDTNNYIRFDDWIDRLKAGHTAFDEDKTDNELLAGFLEDCFGCDLLQYTGLKDKNGVEIFEGDIVEAHNYLTKDGKVFFNDVDKIIFDEERAMFMYGSDYLFSVINCHCEVIGNIYKNKGLLNV